MARKNPLSVNESYHIYNRGVDRRVVFEHDSDRKRFTLLLYLCNGTTPVRFERMPQWKDSASAGLIDAVFGQPATNPIVAIGAYCLMPNHFHLLVREITEGGISSFMHRVATAYTMYFNTGRKRTGALFQGRFKAEHADTDRYLKYLFAYIHLNPVKLIEPNWRKTSIQNLKKVEQFLLSYPYSSYMDYAGVTRKFGKILTPGYFPDYFRNPKEFRENILEWLAYGSDTSHWSPSRTSGRGSTSPKLGGG